MDSSKGPNRVNRAHWPTKENRQNFSNFSIFSVYGKNGLRWPQIGPGGFFPTNPDLADMLGRTDLNFEIFYFFDFLDPTFLDFQVPRSPNSQMSRSPEFQTPPTPTAPDEFSDPNLTPLPMHPGIKYVARALAATCAGVFVCSTEEGTHITIWRYLILLVGRCSLHSS